MSMNRLPPSAVAKLNALSTAANDLQALARAQATAVNDAEHRLFMAQRARDVTSEQQLNHLVRAGEQRRRQLEPTLRAACCYGLQ
jgi:hypothetical protein